MPEFAKGLKLAVPDRDEFEEYFKEHGHDPAVQMESWGANSVPKALYIVRYYPDDDEPYYKCFDHHVNDVVSSNYWDAGLLLSMLDEGVLENTEEYDVDFVEEHE